MLINIWASVLHYGDAFFGTAPSGHGPDLDLLIAEKLSDETLNRQIWMVNAVWSDPGTGNRLLRDGFSSLRGCGDTYLVLYTPGFADVVAGTPADLVGRQASHLARSARAFNKRVLVTALGTPPGAPEAVARRIAEHNDVLVTGTAPFNASVVDLTGLAWEPWSERGSRPSDLDAAAAQIAAAIVDCHAQPETWRLQFRQSAPAQPLSA